MEKRSLVQEVEPLERRREEVWDFIENEGSETIQLILDDFLVRTEKLEAKEKINPSQAVVAFRCIAEHMLNNTFIDHEEEVADMTWPDFFRHGSQGESVE